MAFFDSGKRPRGLRAPSLPGPKANTNTNGLPSRPNQFVASAQRPSDEPVPSPVSAGSAYPPRSTSRPLAGFDKQLPSAPGPASSPAPGAVATGPTPLPSPPSMATDKFSPSTTANIPNGRGVNGLSRPSNHVNGLTAPPGPSAARPNSFAATTPPDDDLGIPLEDFIPDPEDDSAGGSGSGSGSASHSGLTPSQKSDSTTDSWIPPQPEPVAAPITAIHLNCYQAHRHMAPSNNYWYPVPCMTCLKQDRDTRYRCVFCCLRICGSCHSGLQKCEGRELRVFMKGVR